MTPYENNVGNIMVIAWLFRRKPSMVVVIKLDPNKEVADLVEADLFSSPALVHTSRNMNSCNIWMFQSETQVKG
jgi:hypothetical protein